MSHNEHSGWESKITRLREKQLELTWCAPYRDFGLVPSPGAPEAALQSTEARLNLQLPPSYRSFLSKHNGWARLYDGASLLACEKLGDAEHTQMAEQVFAAAASPSARSPANFHKASKALLVFGLDRAGTTLFAFDLAQADAQGEAPVTAWIGEIGLRFADFPTFLAGLTELCEAELALLLDSHALPLSAPRRQEPVEARPDRAVSEPLRKTG